MGCSSPPPPLGREKPHAVMVPYPAQGHITPMLKLAKLLHARGFHVTFVNTEFNHRRLVRSRGPDSVRGLDGFRFEAISDGLPGPSSGGGGGGGFEVDVDVTQDIPSLCDSTRRNSLAPFRRLLAALNRDASVPKVTCIVSDGSMSFTLDAAEELGVPDVQFWTPSACGVMAYLHYKLLHAKGLAPLKSMDDLTNGYLDTPIKCIPGMNNMRLRDYPSFIRTTDPDDVMLQFILHEVGRTTQASAIILNTVDSLESSVLEAMSSMAALPPVYTVGPLHLLAHQLPPPPADGRPTDDDVSSLSSSLWKEEAGCLEWLDGREPGSVVYVNYGSITVMTSEQLAEFAWGLADSSRDFLWVIRPDLVRGGDGAALPRELLAAVGRGRGLLASWCPQEEVLAHPAVGGFLTHCGWNSTLESISAGVPMACWPFFAEQQTNCRYLCAEWGVGVEIESNVRRGEVEKLIKELMGGERGKEMRSKVVQWKESAVRATKPGGSSFENFDRLVKEVLLPSKID